MKKICFTKHMISKSLLENLYLKRRKSVAFIADELDCSSSKINYWLARYEIKKRGIAEAVYLSANPYGDPFKFLRPTSPEQMFLYGLGLGLYWGEGNKMNHMAVRLGNTDPGLLRVFLLFLKQIYRIDQSRLRFGLQVFDDVDQYEAMDYWCRELKVKPSQFQKTATVSRLRRGTYTRKAQYGVLTVYFSNTKLRATIMAAIERLQKHGVNNLPM